LKLVSPLKEISEDRAAQTFRNNLVSLEVSLRDSVVEKLLEFVPECVTIITDVSFGIIQ
jgi:hypothetical protein